MDIFRLGSGDRSGWTVLPACSDFKAVFDASQNRSPGKTLSVMLISEAAEAAPLHAVLAVAAIVGSASSSTERLPAIEREFVACQVSACRSYLLHILRDVFISGA